MSVGGYLNQIRTNACDSCPNLFFVLTTAQVHDKRFVHKRFKRMPSIFKICLVVKVVGADLVPVHASVYFDTNTIAFSSPKQASVDHAEL